MQDLISRQQAIDALRAMQTYKLFAGDDMLLIDQAGAQTELMLLPSAQPDKYWKEQCQSYERTINKLIESLSTQPEIVRCKDCKHRDKYGCCKHWKGLAMGDIPIATDDNDFCSRAERRTE